MGPREQPVKREADQNEGAADIGGDVGESQKHCAQ